MIIIQFTIALISCIFNLKLVKNITIKYIKNDSSQLIIHYCAINRYLSDRYQETRLEFYVSNALL